MRNLVILGSIVVLVLVCLGAAAWWATEPMRFAGAGLNPGGAASQAAPVEVSHPGITRREIVALLRARDFDALTSIVESRTGRALADPQEEWELGRVMDAFEIGDDSLADEFDDWVQAAPDSFAPLLAAAEHRFTLAFLARGERTASQTTGEQFTGMAKQLGLLVEDVGAALAKEPRLSEAYVLLIDAARAGGTQTSCGNAAKSGLEIMPASYRIRASLAICRLPRWGGSYGRVQAIADAADPFVSNNPRLAALHGFVEWDRGRLAKGDIALSHFSAALTRGAHWSFYDSRARVHRGARRFAEALQDSDAALAIAPDSPDVLIGRLYALLGLGRIEQIPSIIELIETIDPMNTDLPAFKEYALKVAAVEGYNLQQESRVVESVARLTAGIALGGGDAEAYYWRGRAYLKDHRENEALEDFEKAVRLDPTHFESCRNIDSIRARRGEWPKVISVWNTYLARKPDDGKAIFERAGAFRHSGDIASAMADARQACELGVQQACAVSR